MTVRGGGWYDGEDGTVEVGDPCTGKRSMQDAALGKASSADVVQMYSCVAPDDSQRGVIRAHLTLPCSDRSLHPEPDVGNLIGDLRGMSP